MPRLYDVCRELDVLVNIDYGQVVNVETGEILPDGVEKINALQIEKDRLLTYFCQMHREDVLDIKKFKEERDRLDKKIKALENHDAFCKSYVTLCLDGEKWKQNGFSVYYMPGRESVVVPENTWDIVKLPAQYIRTEVFAKKAEILAALKRGEEIEGCSIRVGNPATVIR